MIVLVILSGAKDLVARCTARFFAALRMTGLLALAAPALACETLDVQDGWIREAPPGAEVMAGYGTLVNKGKTPITLDGVRSADFGEVSIHEMSMENGQMRMRNAPRIQIEPDAIVVLEPGELHLMLEKPRRDLRAGDAVTLKFDCGKLSRSVDFPVKVED
jgi:copper(I)-binding protein